MPSDYSVWPFGYQFPEACAGKHFVLRRQSAKQLTATMIRMKINGFKNPFDFVTSVARTITGLKLRVV